MNLWRKTIFVAAVLTVLSSVIYAATYTTTLTYFNIASVESFTVTLPGKTAVTATGGGAATSDIEFNASSGTITCVNPCVTAGGTCQSSGTPIFVVQNTGTVNLNITAKFTTALPSCVAVAGSTSWATACSATAMSSTYVTVQNGLAPAASVNWYEQANFTSCLASDTTSKTQWMYGVTS
jgi:hypothetical protein